MDQCSVDIKIDELSYVRWTFWFTTNILYLDSYIIFVRESTRHKYRAVNGYQRLFARNTVFKMNVEDVPLTDDIKKQALDTFMSQIKVMKWNK